jgi:hypothetical protein
MGVWSVGLGKGIGTRMSADEVIRRWRSNTPEVTGLADVNCTVQPQRIFLVRVRLWLWDQSNCTNRLPSQVDLDVTKHRGGLRLFDFTFEVQ